MSLVAIQYDFRRKNKEKETAADLFLKKLKKYFNKFFIMLFQF